MEQKTFCQENKVSVSFLVPTTCFQRQRHPLEQKTKVLDAFLQCCFELLPVRTSLLSLSWQSEV